jgi:pSer/pThr/pTyr-binding forkhead associated (FHA) protein
MPLLNTLKNLFGLTPPNVPGNVPTAAAQQLPPAETARAELYRFVIDQLRIYQQEPTTGIMGLNLFIACADATEMGLYQVATWQNQPGKFRNELDRLLTDNYIQLPKTWTFDIALLEGPLPTCTYLSGQFGLNLTTASQPNQPAQPARLAQLQVLSGQAEQATYPLDPDRQIVFRMGRGHSVQLPNGGVRTNDIAFLNPDDTGFDPAQGEGNAAISRHHATLIYQPDRQRYVLQVDEGGLPSHNNKTKLIHPDGRTTRADLAQAVYPLNDGDIIELGGSGRVLFLTIN